jgi:hypothetical protein
MLYRTGKLLYIWVVTFSNLCDTPPAPTHCFRVVYQTLQVNYGLVIYVLNGPRPFLPCDFYLITSNNVLISNDSEQLLKINCLCVYGII